MRYVVMDLQGNQRESFDSRGELLDELGEGLREDPGSLRALYVVAYDDDGREVGRYQRADEVLATRASGRRNRTWMFDFVAEKVFAVGAPESDPEYREFVTRQQPRTPAGAAEAH